MQVSDTEYEVAQRLTKAPEAQGTCATGQVLQDDKCGKSPLVAATRPPGQLSLSFPVHVARVCVGIWRGQLTWEQGDSLGVPRRGTLALVITVTPWTWALPGTQDSAIFPKRPHCFGR